MSALPRTASGRLELDFAPDAAGITRVSRRRVRYPYTFLQPFWFGDRPAGLATVMLQSASGGLFGGETLEQRITLAAGAAVHVTTQAASVVHAARGHAPARQDVLLQVADGAYLEYLPEPLLLFPDAGLAQVTEIVLARNATVVHAEGFVQHDPGPDGQPFRSLANALVVRASDGRVLLADRAAIDGVTFASALATAHGAWRACGLVVIASPARGDRHAALAAEITRALAGRDPRTLYAAAVLAPAALGVVCRIAAADGAELRVALETCWRSARLALTGAPAPRRRK